MPTSAPPPVPELRARFDAAGGKPIYVRSMFGRIARVYDLMNRVMTGGLDRRWRAFAVRQITLSSGQSALDVGTGTGDLAIALARASAPDSHIVGVDFTPEMLAIGQRKVERLHLSGRITFEVGDGERLNFPDARFDACCSAFVARNLADLPHGFAEMLRVVKPGGRVVCLEISHPYNPVFSALFHVYFDRLVPVLGRILGRSAEAYTYLPASVTTFPDARRLKAIMEDVGWQDVRYFRRLGGVVAIHVGRKPAN